MGGMPFVVDLRQAARQNPFFRLALWTGRNLQVTLMSIPVGGDIGVEVHDDTEQLLYVEEGKALVLMGESEAMLEDQRIAGQNDAILVPAATWHNLINIGPCPLKIFSVYAPPHHPFGTVQKNKNDVEK